MSFYSALCCNHGLQLPSLRRVQWLQRNGTWMFLPALLPIL